MKILAFDTCLDKMYVALGDDGVLIDSKTIETTESHYHSAFLISTIRDIIKESGFVVSDIGAIATNIGPGSFTGIRACTTVARVFAQAENIKTIGISSLEILSKLGSKSRLGFPTQQHKTLVVLDARKEMAYVALYENGEEIIAPKALGLDDIKKIIAQNDCEIITDNKMKEIFGGKSYQNSDEDLGEILIKLAFEKIDKESDFSWKNLHPLYIQPPLVGCKK